MEPSHDHLVRAIASGQDIRIAAVVTTATAIEASDRHKLSPAAGCAMGRAISSGLLLATLTKGEERVTLQIQADGPLSSLNVDANSDGDVRAYTLHPEAGAGLDVSGRFHVATVLGRQGVVNVLRDMGLKDLYQGQVALLTGEIDEDVEGYLRMSEQVPSALGCEVLMTPDGKIQASAGILVQTLPGGDPKAVLEIQHALRTGRLYDLLLSGVTSAQTLAEKIWDSSSLELMGEAREVRFKCRCSEERISDMLQLLTTVDLDEMIADDKPAEVTCNYCSHKYEVGRPTLERIRSQVAGHPREKN